MSSRTPFFSMFSILRVLAVLPAVLASPIGIRQDDNSIAGSWIVKLRDGSSSSLLQSTISEVTDILGSEPKYTYSFGGFQGFSINSLKDVTSLLANIAAIESIELDQRVTTNALTTQQSPPYGLARISHRKPGANNYIYDDSAGAGTYSYIIDTVSELGFCCHLKQR